MFRCSLNFLFLLAIVHSNFAEAEENLGPECFDCKCPRNLDYQVKKVFFPILPLKVRFQCGSDGRSYMNECLFMCAQEKCGERTRGVVITRRGRCDE